MDETIGGFYRSGWLKNDMGCLFYNLRKKCYCSAFLRIRERSYFYQNKCYRKTIQLKEETKTFKVKIFN
jgi:hypothetical protein